MLSKRLILALIGLTLASSSFAATLVYKGKTYTKADEIGKILKDEGIDTFEQWPVIEGEITDEAVLARYKTQIEKIMRSRPDYVTVDLAALRPTMENFQKFIDAFKTPHFHSDDEIRYTVSGDGVFHISHVDSGEDIKYFDLTVEPGDLIIIPKGRAHSFTLTDKQFIRCIRVYKDKEGWKGFPVKAAKN